MSSFFFAPAEMLIADQREARRCSVAESYISIDFLMPRKTHARPFSTADTSRKLRSKPVADDSPAQKASARVPSSVRQSPNRPASIRTLSGAICSGASWCPQFQRVLPSRNRTEPPLLPEVYVPCASRSHPNSTILSSNQNLTRLLLSFVLAAG